MTAPTPPEGYASWLDRVVSVDQPDDGCTWRPEVLDLARVELAALRAEQDLLRAVYDAATENSVRWVREDGGENKLAVAIANVRRNHG